MSGAMQKRRPGDSRKGDIFAFGILLLALPEIASNGLHRQPSGYDATQGPWIDTSQGLTRPPKDEFIIVKGR